MKLTFLAVAMAAVLSGASSAATIVQGDPSPNDYDPVTGETTNGGINFRFTAQLGGTDSGQVTGHVGAWSWDEDGNPVTARGWTHTSHWIALTLGETCLLTVRLERNAAVPNPTPEDPLALAGANLYPGMSLYGGWDADGGDEHTYNNQGNIEWAEDVVYLNHFSTSAEGVIERTWLLPAGNYSVAMGGNSPAAVAEGRQGYLATLSTRPVPEPCSTLLVLAGALLTTRRRTREGGEVDFLATPLTGEPTLIQVCQT